MALIKCPECGKEISDKAPACINCGCPVSAMKTESAKPAEAEKTNFGFTDFNQTFGQFFNSSSTSSTTKAASPTPSQQTVTQKTQMGTVTTKAPSKPDYNVLKQPVPKSIPEMKLLPGIIVQLLEKACGVVGLAGFTALGGIIVGFLSGFSASEETWQIAILGLAGNQILAYLSSLMEFWHVKRYLKRNNHVEAIREDDASYTNCIAAFKLNKTKHMARYIKRLNPTAGEALEKGIKKGIKEGRKKLLKTIPFMVILMALYYLLPRLEEAYILPYESSLIICHIVTFITMIMYERKIEFKPFLAVYIGAIFAPTIFAYFISDMWYHIAICAGAALLGQLVGYFMPDKN